ncbi:hypothetical protein SPFM1_00281 [Salmonella phage SPFM1]|nr:hypothetical protein SPFM1_00281 [Salmonella phage SPFM1]
MVAQIKMDLENLYGSQSVVYRGNIKSLAYTQAVLARTPQEKARELMNHYTESGYTLNLTGANMIAVGTLSTRGCKKDGASAPLFFFTGGCMQHPACQLSTGKMVIPVRNLARRVKIVQYD